MYLFLRIKIIEVKMSSFLLENDISTDSLN